MSNTDTPLPQSDKSVRHLRITQPSPWVSRWAHLIETSGTVLDLAAGGGRHGRLFLDRGHTVTFVDRTAEPLADLRGHERAEVIEADLEDGSPWPLAERRFDAVVVVNYLHRELFERIIASLKPGGVLIYETFARGNEDFTRPRNPDHLLKSGELLQIVHGQLQVVAYEHGLVQGADITGVKQRLCAINDLSASIREDGEPPAHEISRV
ncbi:class I SAM-dependent methyltransferase [Magnetovibrio sp.]|uniref:class I SAM-dependent methyltransferase n=1 Tax=Magnetovibrio sp. TaxID=2024836 RepID=UPI002F94D970